MNSRNSSLFCLALALLAMSSAIEAFDITQMLGKYPELGLFNQYLSETKLADQINSRKTITILALDNSSISAIAGKPKDTIKAILSTHVILDYFDEQKLMSTVGSQNTQLTTLYQTTGPVNNLQGFIKVGVIGEGEIAFGSAVNGAPLNAELVQTLTTQPYEISIMQVARPIVAPGIDASASSSQPPSSSSASSSPPPSSSKASSSSASSSPPPSKAAAAAPKAEAPVASRKHISPAAKSPVEVETPLSAPEGAPVSAPEGAPVSTPGEAPEPASSSSSRIQMGLVWAAVMGLGALLVAM